MVDPKDEDINHTKDQSMDLEGHIERSWICIQNRKKKNIVNQLDVGPSISLHAES